MNISIPKQHIRESQKNQKFIEDTLDALFLIARSQKNKNKDIEQLDKLISGKYTYEDYKSNAFMKGYQDLVEDITSEEIEQIEHFDFLGNIVNQLVGVFFKRTLKVTVDYVGEHATSKYLRDKRDLFEQMVTKDLENELRYQLVQRGIDPSTGGSLTEEEQAQLQQQIDGIKRAITPDDIEDRMKKEWHPSILEFANKTIKQDRERFKISDLERKNLESFIKNGRCFREIKITENNYNVINWDNKDVFYDLKHKGDYPNEGEYLGRLRNLTGNQILKEYGYLMDAKTQEKIGSYFSSTYYGADKTSIDKELFKPSLTREFRGYEEYKFGKDVIEGQFGHNVDMPMEFNEISFGDGIYKGEPMTLQTMDAYWVSWKMVGTYIDEEGNAYTVIEDDIDKESLKYHKIKTAKNMPLAELVRLRTNKLDYGRNIIYWDWEQEIRWGVKIMLNSENENIYLGGESIAYAPKDINDKPLIPVASIALEGSQIAKAAPYQANFNIMLNLINRYLKNDLGVLLITDLRAFPTDLADEIQGGDGRGSIGKLQALYDTVKKTGMLPQDFSPANMDGGSNGQQIGAQNLSNMSLRNNLMNEARNFRTLAFESIGITDQQVLGTQTSVYQSDRNLEVSKNVGYSQTDMMFENFIDFHKRELELRLEVAKWAKANGYDNTSIYMDSDYNKYLIEQLNEEDLTFAKFRIHAQDDHAKRASMEALKAYYMNENTSSMKLLERADLVFADTVSEILSIGKLSEEKEAKYQEEMQRKELEKINAQKNAELEINNDLHAKEIEKIREKGKIDIIGKGVVAEGFDQKNLNTPDIMKQVELGLKEIKTNNDNINTQNANELKRLELEKKDLLENKKLSLKEKEIDARIKVADGEKYIAKINKN